MFVVPVHLIPRTFPYANSITLTPGTVSIWVHGHAITVYALSQRAISSVLASASASVLDTALTLRGTTFVEFLKYLGKNTDSIRILADFG